MVSVDWGFVPSLNKVFIFKISANLKPYVEKVRHLSKICSSANHEQTALDKHFRLSFLGIPIVNGTIPKDLPPHQESYADITVNFDT